MEGLDRHRSPDALVEPVVNALKTLADIQRHLHPMKLAAAVERLSGLDTPIAEARAELASLRGDAGQLVSSLDGAMDSTLRSLQALRAVSTEPDGIFQAYAALRHTAYAMEALYGVINVCTTANEYFWDADAGAGRLPPAHQATSMDHGVHHFDNERGSRGGYSVYVPEHLALAEPVPLVVALHGGRGHGRAFLWTWLRDARAQGVILASPTARGSTWSLMGPDVDSENLDRIVEELAGRWPIDRGRALLTGMSDGGTFTYLSGLRRASPFTHLAPVAACFASQMLEMIEAPRVTGRPFYLVHGREDWMFPAALARTAHQTLTKLGGLVVHREIPDLSHTYPGEENRSILHWLLEGRVSS